MHRRLIARLTLRVATLFGIAAPSWARACALAEGEIADPLADILSIFGRPLSIVALVAFAVAGGVLIRPFSKRWARIFVISFGVLTLVGGLAGWKSDGVARVLRGDPVRAPQTIAVSPGVGC